MIKNSDLEAAFGRYARSLAVMKPAPKAGHTLTLIHGSKPNGQSYRAVWRDDVSGGWSQGPGTVDGHLGMTKREAYNTLRHLARAFEDAGYATAVEMWA
jgi:hypothetical protein